MPNYALRKYKNEPAEILPFPDDLPALGYVAGYNQLTSNFDENFGYVSVHRIDPRDNSETLIWEGEDELHEPGFKEVYDAYLEIGDQGGGLVECVHCGTIDLHFALRQGREPELDYGPVK